MRPACHDGLSHPAAMPVAVPGAGGRYLPAAPALAGAATPAELRALRGVCAAAQAYLAAVEEAADDAAYARLEAAVRAWQGVRP